MTAEVVNLRRARKLKLRVEKEAKADENRKLFGRSKHEKRLREATRELQDKELSGKKRVIPAAADDAENEA